MSNSLHQKGCLAAERFITRKGMNVIDRDFTTDNGTIDLIAQDEDNTIVFLNVTASAEDKHFPDMDNTERGVIEVLACEWMTAHNNEVQADCSLRYDKVDMLIVAQDRAILRHHINAWS